MCVCVRALLTHAPFVLDEGPERHHSFQLHKTQWRINHTGHTSHTDGTRPHHTFMKHLSMCPSALRTLTCTPHVAQWTVASSLSPSACCKGGRGGRGGEEERGERDGRGGGEGRKGREGRKEGDGKGEGERRGEIHEDIKFCRSFSPPPCLCLLTTPLRTSSLDGCGW